MFRLISKQAKLHPEGWCRYIEFEIYFVAHFENYYTSLYANNKEQRKGDAVFEHVQDDWRAQPISFFTQIHQH